MRISSHFESILLPIILIICGCICHSDSVDGIQNRTPKDMLMLTVNLISSFAIIYIITSQVSKLYNNKKIN